MTKTLEPVLIDEAEEMHNEGAPIPANTSIAREPASYGHGGSVPMEPRMTVGQKYDEIRYSIDALRGTLDRAIKDEDNRDQIFDRLEAFEATALRMAGSRKELVHGKGKVKSQHPAP